MIEDDGFVLVESGAILLYLAEKAGRLADLKTRASVTRWCFAALTTVEPVVAMIVLTDFEKKTDDVTKERRANLVKWADRGLAGLETWLGEHAYVTGAEFTVADILMTTVLRQARRAGPPRKVPEVRGLSTEVRSAPRVASHRRCLRGAPRPRARRGRASSGADGAQIVGISSAFIGRTSRSEESIWEHVDPSRTRSSSDWNPKGRSP